MDIDKIISEALAEDLGDGDHSSLSTIPEDAKVIEDVRKWE